MVLVANKPCFRLNYFDSFNKRLKYLRKNYPIPNKTELTKSCGHINFETNSHNNGYESNNSNVIKCDKNFINEEFNFIKSQENINCAINSGLYEKASTLNEFIQNINSALEECKISESLSDFDYYSDKSDPAIYDHLGNYQTRDNFQKVFNEKSFNEIQLDTSSQRSSTPLTKSQIDFEEILPFQLKSVGLRKRTPLTNDLFTPNFPTYNKNSLAVSNIQSKSSINSFNLNQIQLKNNREKNSTNFITNNNQNKGYVKTNISHNLFINEYKDLSEKFQDRAYDHKSLNMHQKILLSNKGTQALKLNRNLIDKTIINNRDTIFNKNCSYIDQNGLLINKIRENEVNEPMDNQSIKNKSQIHFKNRTSPMSFYSTEEQNKNLTCNKNLQNLMNNESKKKESQSSRSSPYRKEIKICINKLPPLPKRIQNEDNENKSNKFRIKILLSVSKADLNL